MIPVDYKGISDEVVDELVKGRYAREYLEVEKAKVTQKRIARQMGEHRAMDDIGQPVMAVDPMVYWAWANKFKTTDCWKDKGFRKYIANNFEETRVRKASGCNGGTKISTGYTGNKKYSKNYGELKSENH